MRALTPMRLDTYLRQSGISPDKATIYNLDDFPNNSFDDALEHATNGQKSSRSAEDEYVVFTAVPPESLDVSDASIRTYYDKPNSVVVAEMPAKLPHEAVAGRIGVDLFGQWEKLNIETQCANRAEVIGRDGSRKCPSNSWYLLSVVKQGGNIWPVMVLEVFVTESLRKIQKDVSFWLTQFDEEKRPIVLTIQAIEKDRKLVATVWERSDGEVKEAHRLAVYRPIDKASSDEYEGDELTIPVHVPRSNTSPEDVEGSLFIGKPLLSEALDAFCACIR